MLQRCKVYGKIEQTFIKGKENKKDKGVKKMVLPPFKTEQYQKVVSSVALMIGIIFLISESLWTLNIFGFKVSMFIVGIILAFFGLLYLFDVI